MRALPPPRLAAAGYEHLGYGLLLAATPPGLGSDYNKRRGELWGRCQSLRTLPSPDEFERTAEGLRDLLRAAAASGRAKWDGSARRDLVRAARVLDVVEDEARRLGLLA